MHAKIDLTGNFCLGYLNLERFPATVFILDKLIWYNANIFWNCAQTKQSFHLISFQILSNCIYF